MSRLFTSAAVLGLFVTAAASAETLYVTDLLRLGVHRAADTSDRAFDSLVSGTPLEILESNVNYARVRLTDGREGWVKAAYLVEEKPARLRLTEMEAELAALREELAAATQANADARREAVSLEERLQADQGSADALGQSLARVKQQNENYEARFERYRLSLPLSWVAAALVLTLVGGFVGGWWWLDALIRRRHGGFRVY